MANHTVLENQLTPGAQIFVRGKVTFARLAKRIEGDELAKDQERRRRQGSIPIDKPYTTISICEATVLPKGPNMTPDDLYVQECFYTSQKPENPGWNYTVTNKSPFPPYIAQIRDGNPNMVDQIKPKGELAVGLDVVLVLRVFQSKPYAGRVGRNSISLDGVIAQEPIRYYSNSDATARLAERGIVYNALPPEELGNNMPTENMPANQGAPAITMPGATPVSAPAGYPFATQTAQAAPTEQNAGFGMNPPTQPAPAATNPAQGAAAMPNGVTAGGYNPYAGNYNAGAGQANTQQTGGIRYDMNDPNRAY